MRRIRRRRSPGSIVGIKRPNGGTVNNFGTIGGGVEIFGGSVNPVGYLTNGSPTDTAALIEGLHGVRVGAVTNFGTIEGNSEAAMRLVNGSAADTQATISDTVFMGQVHGSTVIAANYGTLGGLYIGAGGRVTNGAANGTGALIGNAGVTTGGASRFTAVTNFGTILNYEQVFPPGGVNLGYGGGSVINGSLQNSAALIAGASGLLAGGAATIINHGTIRGASKGGWGGDLERGGGLINGSLDDRSALIADPVEYARGVQLYHSASGRNFGAKPAARAPMAWAST
ncbi:MAG: hypothetical protein ACR2FH_03810 [Caulobacteraceae bacterium]